MRGLSNLNKIILFLILTLLLSAWPYSAMIRTGRVDGLPVLALMWAPGLAALLTQFITTRSLAGLGWRLGKGRYLLTSLLIPFAASLVVYGFAWGVGLVPFTAAGLVDSVAGASGQRLSLAVALLMLVGIGLPMSLFSGLGEELGWRGMLLPELAKRYSFTVSALVSGVIWAIFHYPLMLFADYHSDAPLWFALTMFTISVLSISFIAAWLRLKSGSVWPAALLHASHNLFVQSIFDPMTLDFGLAPYITTEFGAGLALAYALVAFYTWRRRNELADINRASH